MGFIIAVTLIVVVGGLIYWAAGKFTPHLRDGSRIGSTIRSVARVVILLALALVTIFNSFNQVPAGHVGIVYSFGGIVGQKGEGAQWVLPWRDVVSASVQVQGHKFDKLDSFSQETQDVFVAATINIQVLPKDIQNLYREVGKSYFDVLVRPRVLQAFKDETVKYASVKIAPNREGIRKEVRERLTKELQAHSIAVQDLLVDDISFTEKFQNAIEEKQAQTQLALAEREKVAGEKAKADQAVETAKGRAASVLLEAEKQAEAIAKLNASITPAYTQYLFASKLAPNVSVMMVPSGQQFIMGSDMLTPKKATVAVTGGE